MKIYWLTCEDCSMQNLHQPCEACKNYFVQKGNHE